MPAGLALLAAAQNVEHYEISGYGTARTLALQLSEVARLLSSSRGEEEITDFPLMELSKPILQEMLAGEFTCRKIRLRRSRPPAAGGKGARRSESPHRVTLPEREIRLPPPFSRRLRPCRLQGYAGPVPDADAAPVRPSELADYSDDGVDLTMIRWMLSLTPLERLQFLEDRVNDLLTIRERNAGT